MSTSKTAKDIVETVKTIFGLKNEMKMMEERLAACKNSDGQPINLDKLASFAANDGSLSKSEACNNLVKFAHDIFIVVSHTDPATGIYDGLEPLACGFAS